MFSVRSSISLKAIIPLTQQKKAPQPLISRDLRLKDQRGQRHHQDLQPAETNRASEELPHGDQARHEVQQLHAGDGG